MRTEKVMEVYNHFYGIFDTPAKWRYPFDSKLAIDYWLKQFTVQELKDAATNFRETLKPPYTGKSARYFYGCKRRGKDFGMFRNFLGEIEDPEEVLLKQLKQRKEQFSRLCGEGGLSKVDKARIKAGQWPTKPWSEAERARELAREIHMLIAKIREMRVVAEEAKQLKK